MKLNRNEVILVGLVALIVLLCGLLPFGLLFGFGGMMGSGMMGPWMMGGTAFFWLLLILLLVLILLGVVLLVSSRENISHLQANNKPLPADEVRCPHCSRTVQPDWQVCPYCGEPLKGEEKL